MSFFKEEDFNKIIAPFCDCRTLAKLSNFFLYQRGVRVYGSDKRPLDGWNEKTYESTTHQALLINIEELPKKECEHKNIIAVGMPDELSKSGPYFELKQPRIDCVDCGKELKVHK